MKDEVTKFRGKRILNFAMIATSLVIVAMIVAGCSSTSIQQNQQSSSGITPSATIIATTSPTTTTTQIEMRTQSVTGYQRQSTTKVFKPFQNDTYRLNMMYPADWETEEISEVAYKSYAIKGEKAIENIVNFYSPSLPDQSYASFSIDVDPNIITDLEDYYNHAVVGLELFHGQITKTMPNCRISEKPAWRIDFVYYDSKINTTSSDKNKKVVQIFTLINDNIFIISYKGYGPAYDEYLDEGEEMINSIIVSPKIERKLN